MRGEHCSSTLSLTPRRGSSPHARGTPWKLQVGGAFSGIIPACAGNTFPLMISPPFGGDHPRMRGEHCSNRSFSSPCQGSSPHARGTHSGSPWVPLDQGIIPACAGNTWSRCRAHPSRRDHPRMRGEHLSTCSVTSAKKGSSPHARGTLVTGADVVLFPGIIPACAGNTVRTPWRSCHTRDHPRMRGEHLEPDVWTSRVKGSSPHARGTLHTG